MNVAPSVSAGANQSIKLPVASATLNGTATDSDGTIASYLWIQVTGPKLATLANATTKTLSVSALVAGTYTFRLSAKDNDGATGTDTVNVVVSAADPVNQAPNVSAGADQTVQLPKDSVTFAGAATDADGTIASLAWTQLSGPKAAVLTNATALTASAGSLVSGTYVFQLLGKDNDGALDSDTVSVVVKPAVVVTDDPALDGVQKQYPLDPTISEPYGMGHYLYRPENYSDEPTKKWPLLVFMHGLGECGSGSASALPQVLGLNSPGAQIKNGIAKNLNRPFLNGLVLTPQSSGTWNAGRVHALIEYIKTQVRVDPDRIYITGLSLGGGGTWNYGVTYPSEIAALVPIAGTEQGIGTSEKLSQIPTWAFHAFTDTNSYNSLNPVGSLFRCKGGTPAACTFERLDRMSPFASTRVLAGYSANGGLTKAATTRTGALVGAGASGLPLQWAWADGTLPTNLSSQTIVTVQFQNSHDSWTAAFGNAAMWSWMYAQKRRAPPAIAATLTRTTPATIAGDSGAEIGLKLDVALGKESIVEVVADLREFGGSAVQKLSKLDADTYVYTHSVPDAVKTTFNDTRGIGVTVVGSNGTRTVKFVSVTLTP